MANDMFTKAQVRVRAAMFRYLFTAALFCALGACSGNGTGLADAGSATDAPLRPEVDAASTDVAQPDIFVMDVSGVDTDPIDVPGVDAPTNACVRQPERDMTCRNFWSRFGQNLPHAYACPNVTASSKLDVECSSTASGDWSGFCCPILPGATSPDASVADRPPTTDIVVMDGPEILDVGGEIAEAGIDDRPPTPSDAALGVGPMCGPLTSASIARVGPSTTVHGDTTAAWMLQTMGRPISSSQIVSPPAGVSACVPMRGQLVYAYTTGATPVALSVTTTNSGTAANFDTVLYVSRTFCSARLLLDTYCNDDDPRYAGTPLRRVSSYVVTEVFPPRTLAFIVVGGYYPPGDGTATTDHGMFDLTITELSGVAEGGVCDPDGVRDRCSPSSSGGPLSCVPDQYGAATGRCLAPGSVAGSRCRTSSFARCDDPLTCGVSGVCQRQASADMPCDPFSVCPDGYSCLVTTLGAVRGICRRFGASLGSPCRAMGSSEGRCDAPLVCAFDVDTLRSEVCVRSASMGGECDAFRSVCPSGSSCVTSNDLATIGICRPDGAGLRTRCRLTAPECDDSLVCGGSAGGNVCVRRSTTNMPCDSELACPDGEACVLTDRTDRVRGVCGAAGQLGGACLEGAAVTCSGSATCSSVGGGGTCSNEVGAGAACDRIRARCAVGLTCVSPAGTFGAGTCQPDGEVAGAKCRSGDTPCASGLTCGGSALSGDVCARSVAAGAACDPVAGTALCPSGQYCLANAFNAGVCTSTTASETEPDDAPADVATRPAATSTLYLGTLERFDVDCYPVRVPAGGRVIALVSDGNGRCPVNLGATLALDLYGSDGVTVRGIAMRNGPTNAGFCSHIDGGRVATYPWAAGLAAGTYYVCVRGWEDPFTRVATDRVAQYALSLGSAP